MQGALTSWPSCERGPSVPCVSFDQMCYDVVIAVRIFVKAPLRDPRISVLPPLRRGSFGTTRQRIFLAVCVFPLQGALAPGYEPGDSRSFNSMSMLFAVRAFRDLILPHNSCRITEKKLRTLFRVRSFLILTLNFSVFSAFRSPFLGIPRIRPPPRGGRRRGCGSPARAGRCGRT